MMHYDRVVDRVGMGLPPGSVVPLAETYCATMLADAAPALIVPDAGADPRFTDKPATHLLGIGAYSGVPLDRADGQLYGTLCTLHPTPRPIPEGELVILQLAGRIIVQAVEAAARTAELAAAQERLQSIVEQLPCGIMVVDAHGDTTLTNAVARQMRLDLFDVSQHPVDQRTTNTTGPGATISALIGHALSGERAGARDVTYHHLGETEPDHYQASAAPLYDATGQVAGAVAICADVTHERALKVAEERLRAMYGALSYGVIVLDEAGQIVDANDAAHAVAGAGEQSLRGKPMTHVFGEIIIRPDGTPLTRDEQPWFRARATGQTVGEPAIRLTRADGRQRWLQVDAVPLCDEGQVRRVVVTCIDITKRMRAEKALRQREEWFRTLSEHASDLVIICGAGGMVQYASPSVTRVLGYARDEVESHNILEFAHPDDHNRMATTLAQRVREIGVWDPMEFCVRHKDGSWRIVEALSNNRLDDPTLHGIIVNIRDITERTQAEESLRASEERFRSVTRLAHDAIISADAHGAIVSWNRGAAQMFGYTEDEAVGQALTMLMPERFRAAHQSGLARATATGVVGLAGQTIEIVGRCKDGREFPIELSLATWTTAEGRFYSGIIRDITERKRMEERLRHQALHDALTDLPNRTLLHDRLQQALQATTLARQPLALLLLDLDRFKEVNDTFGHHHGDLLLRQVVERLRDVLRSTDTVARLGGDEFAVLLPGSEISGATGTAERIGAALGAPFMVEGLSLQIGGSVGIALCPEHGHDADTLLRRADVAMYVAKRAGHPHAVYSPEQDEYTPDRLALIGDLRRAIAGGELLLHYQPKVDLGSGMVSGAEALVRWPHPRRGLVRPDQFIPLAEQTGLMTPLTLWVVEEAPRQCHRWRRAGLHLTVAVNLSSTNLHDPDLPAAIAEMLRTHRLPPTALRLEVTESTLMADMARARETVTRLAALGIGLSVDDYGTGYSSLAYLKRLPVDELKIDMSFVRQMAHDAADVAIASSTVGLGHSLGLRVVAEGVEDRETWDRLAAMGCDQAQGYYLSRPVPAADFVEWLRASRRASA